MVEEERDAKVGYVPVFEGGVDGRVLREGHAAAGGVSYALFAS